MFAKNMWSKFIMSLFIVALVVGFSTMAGAATIKDLGCGQGLCPGHCRGDPLCE